MTDSERRIEIDPTENRFRLQTYSLLFPDLGNIWFEERNGIEAARSSQSFFLWRWLSLSFHICKRHPIYCLRRWFLRRTLKNLTFSSGTILLIICWWGRLSVNPIQCILTNGTVYPGSHLKLNICTSMCSIHICQWSRVSIIPFRLCTCRGSIRKRMLQIHTVSHITGAARWQSLEMHKGQPCPQRLTDLWTHKTVTKLSQIVHENDPLQSMIIWGSGRSPKLH